MKVLVNENMGKFVKEILGSIEYYVNRHMLLNEQNVCLRKNTRIGGSRPIPDISGSTKEGVSNFYTYCWVFTAKNVSNCR